MSFPATRARPPVPLPLTTAHIPSRIACSFSGVMSNFDCAGGVGTGFQPLPLPSSDRLDEVGCDARAAVGDRRHVDRHRHRRHRDRALADAYRDRFAGVPLLMPGLLLPLGRWHQTRDLVGQIDAALHAKPEQRGPLVDAIDAEHVGDGVEVDVARLRNRGLEVDRPVAALLPALEIASVEVGPASAVHVEVRIDDVLFEAGQRRPPS